MNFSCTVFTGPLPPPVHGMSTMNSMILKKLIAQGVKVDIIRTEPKSLKRDLLSRLSRIPKISEGIFRLMRLLKRHHTLYISISGGWGKLYDVIMVLIGKCCQARIIIHHHTYGSLLIPDRLTSMLFRLAGKKAIHIVLCKKMAEDLYKAYAIENTIIMSNLAALVFEAECRPRKKLKSIGFIGNITYEKGALEIMDLAKEISNLNLPLNFFVAGPCTNKPLRTSLEKMNSQQLIKWLGPVYENKKLAFFKSIDALIMPTRYANEAEPLVIWEALSAGIPVISYNRGCISTQLPKSAGVIIREDDKFTIQAIDTIQNWLSVPTNFEKASFNAIRHYHNSVKKNNAQWEKFLNMFKSTKNREFYPN